MKAFIYILVAGIFLSFNSYSQGLSGDYSVANGVSTTGQFPSFTGPLNSTGTISCSDTSLIITGSGTSFTTQFSVDELVYDAGGWVNGTVIGQVASIESDTKITLYATAAITLSPGSKFCGHDAPCAFAAINAYGLDGNITLTVNGPDVEPGTNSLKKWAETGAGGYFVTINCYWGNLIEGADVPANAAGVIRLDGCNNVNMVGGDPWGANLTVRNLRTGSPALVFINGANHNVIGPSCSFESQNTNTSGNASTGAIVFGTTNTTAGNSFNTIKGCALYPRTDVPTIAHEGICSYGTPAYPNTNDSIINCDFNNLENYGIWITSTGNGDGWYITGNNFHWDNPTPATTAQSGIYFDAGAASNSNTITGNYVGRDGPPYWYGEWPNSGAVTIYGIYINAGTTTVTTVKGNYVAHINMTNTGAASLYGMYINNGLLKIDSNYIGDGYWLYIGPQNTLTLAGTGTLAGIYAKGGTNLDISNNQLYALTRTNSGAGATSQLIGIGVESTVTTAKITNNIVNSLTASGAYTGVGNLSSVCGIFNYAGGMGQYVYNNSIAGLENTYTGTNVVSITGIALSGPATNVSPFNICTRNNIYIDGNCRNGATLRFANIIGVDIQGAAYDIVNNMMMLGYDEFWYPNDNPYIISGIKKSTSNNVIDNIYYNSVLLVGSSNSSTARNTYCYNANGAANTADKIKNNIFFNARNNTGTSGTHYAMYFNTNNIFDHNDYYVTGTGGLLSNGNATLPLKAGQDANSVNADPDFLEEHCQPCPWNNLHITTGCALHGKGFDLSTNNPPYTEDYDGQTRPSKPFIGGDEFPYAVSITPAEPIDICTGTSVTLSAEGLCPDATYTWAPATGLNATDIPNPVANPSVTTTYTVIAAETNGFTDTATVVVSVGISITVAPHPSYCTADSAGVARKTATLPYTAVTGHPDKYNIVWDAAAHTAGFVDVTNAALPANPIIIKVPGGVSSTYNGTITVKNSATGCTSAPTPFELILVAGVPQDVSVTGLPAVPPHEGDSVLLTVNINASYPATSYSWYHWLSPTGTIVTFTDSLIKNPVVYNGTGTSGAGITWIFVYATNGCGSSYPNAFYNYAVVPKYTAKGPTTCGGHDGSITFTGLNPPGGYSSNYDISYSFNGIVQPTILNLNADAQGNEVWGNLPEGTYTNIQIYWARNGHSCGCVTASAPVDTIVLTSPTCNGPTITLGSDPSACYNNNTQTANLTYSATTLSPDQYKITWSNAAITAGFANVNYSLNNLTASPIAISIPAGAVASTYNGKLTVKNNTSGKESGDYSMNIVINPVPVITATSFSICSGSDSAGFHAACTQNCGNGITYLWSPAAFLSSDTAANPAAGPTISTTYTVTATSDNSCTTSATAVVAVDNKLVPAVDITATLNTICAGTSVTFSAIPGNGGNAPSFQWKKNGLEVGTDSAGYTGNTFQDNDIITCEMTSNALCVTQTATTSNSIPLIIAPPAKAGIVTFLNDTICSGTIVSLSVTGNTGTLKWQSAVTPGAFTDINGATSTKYIGPLASNATFRVIARNGTCYDTSAAVGITVMPALVAEFTSVEVGPQVTFTDESTGAISWNWEFGDSTTSTEQSPVHTYSGNGTYKVCLNAYNGHCSYTICRNLDITTGINSVTAKSALIIYPNPASDNIIIENANCNATGQGEILLYDVSGRIIISSKIEQGSSCLYNINVSALAPGTYLLSIKMNTGIYYTKLIKQ